MAVAASGSDDRKPKLESLSPPQSHAAAAAAAASHGSNSKPGSGALKYRVKRDDDTSSEDDFGDGDDHDELDFLPPQRERSWPHTASSHSNSPLTPRNAASSANASGSASAAAKSATVAGAKRAAKNAASLASPASKVLKHDQQQQQQQQQPPQQQQHRRRRESGKSSSSSRKSSPRATIVAAAPGARVDGLKAALDEQQAGASGSSSSLFAQAPPPPSPPPPTSTGSTASAEKRMQATSENAHKTSRDPRLVPTRNGESSSSSAGTSSAKAPTAAAATNSSAESRKRDVSHVDVADKSHLEQRTHPQHAGGGGVGGEVNGSSSKRPRASDPAGPTAAPSPFADTRTSTAGSRDSRAQWLGTHFVGDPALPLPASAEPRKRQRVEHGPALGRDQPPPPQRRAPDRDAWSATTGPPAMRSPGSFASSAAVGGSLPRGGGGASRGSPSLPSSPPRTAPQPLPPRPMTESLPTFRRNGAPPAGSSSAASSSSMPDLRDPRLVFRETSDAHAPFTHVQAFSVPHWATSSSRPSSSRSQAPQPLRAAKDRLPHGSHGGASRTTAAASSSSSSRAQASSSRRSREEPPTPGPSTSASNTPPQSRSRGGTRPRVNEPTVSPPREDELEQFQAQQQQRRRANDTSWVFDDDTGDETSHDGATGSGGGAANGFARWRPCLLPRRSHEQLVANDEAVVQAPDAPPTAAADPAGETFVVEVPTTSTFVEASTMHDQAEDVPMSMPTQEDEQQAVVDAAFADTALSAVANASTSTSASAPAPSNEEAQRSDEGEEKLRREQEAKRREEAAAAEEKRREEAAAAAAAEKQRVEAAAAAAAAEEEKRREAAAAAAAEEEEEEEEEEKKRRRDEDEAKQSRGERRAPAKEEKETPKPVVNGEASTSSAGGATVDAAAIASASTAGVAATMDVHAFLASLPLALDSLYPQFVALDVATRADLAALADDSPVGVRVRDATLAMLTGLTPFKRLVLIEGLKHLRESSQ